MHDRFSTGTISPKSFLGACQPKAKTCMFRPFASICQRLKASELDHWPRKFHYFGDTTNLRQYWPTTIRTLAQAAALETPVDDMEALKWSHHFTERLPGDSNTTNSLRQVHDAFYSFVTPTPTDTEAYLVAKSSEMAEEIGLDQATFAKPDFAKVFSGNAMLSSIEGKTWAQCYGGHQFGNWAGQLGDGRAISLGEITGPSGKQWELQLKGAGKTPYSRMADGRAVMRSSVREFICSEAMHHLGVPTTRALSLVGTGAQVVRDMFYNGNIKAEPGAVVCRVSPSFVRFGTFQLPASRGGLQVEMVGLLADFIIENYYPHLKEKDDPYAQLLTEVAARTGKLVALWQSVGFVHGVLNTDNMSILGETIDYGPFGFLEAFDPGYTPNTTDEMGRRYTFQQQPSIGQQNLAQLAQAFLIAGLTDEDSAQRAVEEYGNVLMPAYNSRMASKMGLKEYNRELSVGLLTAMYEDRADFTNSFRALADISVDDAADSIPESLQAALPEKLSGEREATWKSWLTKYREALKSQDLSEAQRRELQNSVNPCYIPRNHLLQEVIAEAEAGNYKAVQDYLELLKKPYEEQPGKEQWQKPSGGVIRRGIEMLSCSS